MVGSCAYKASLFLASVIWSRSPWYSTTYCPFWNICVAKTPLPFPSMYLTCQDRHEGTFVPVQQTSTFNSIHCQRLPSFHSQSRLWSACLCASSLHTVDGKQAHTHTHINIIALADGTHEEHKKSVHYLQFAFAFSAASSDGIIICNLSALRDLGISTAKQTLIHNPRMSFSFLYNNVYW